MANPMTQPPIILPSILEEIAEATSVAVALKVARKAGGRRCYFPNDPKPDHWLSQTVGHEDAVKLCKALTPSSGMEFLIPLGPVAKQEKRKQEIRELIMQGWSNPAIAVRVGIHSRTVMNHRQKLRQQGIKMPVVKRCKNQNI